MYDRRNTLGLAKRIRAFIWPERGFARALKYFAIRLFADKHITAQIAAGFASGAAISITPLLGLQILLGCAVTFVTRGSMVATALGTLVGNPLTFPLFFSATYWIGARVREIAVAHPAEVIETIVADLDEAAEAEADAAADAVLNAADDNYWKRLESCRFRNHVAGFSTTLIGSIALFSMAYGVFYLVARLIVRALRANGRAGLGQLWQPERKSGEFRVQSL